MPRIAQAARTGSPEPYSSTAQVAEFLGVPEKSLITWRYNGTGPKYYRCGKHVRYRLSEVAAWMETRDASLAGAGNGRA